MPTIAEPAWELVREKRRQAVLDFLAAIPGTVSASPDVLSARLFGLGLRGQELKAEVRLAEMARLEAAIKRPDPEAERIARSASIVTRLMRQKDH